MFFPFCNIQLNTKKTVAEVIRIIQNNTSERTMFSRLAGNNTYFEGKIINNSFKISRVIRYRNSFLPIIIGIVEDGVQNTKIRIKMRLNLFVIVFGIIWFTGVLFGLISFIPNIMNIKNNVQESISAFIPLFMLVFGYLLFTIPFKIESKIAENKLIELVNGLKI